MSKFYDLNVKAIEKETPTSVVVYFDVPNHLEETFYYTAGQYITLATTIDGKEVRRAYSLCTAPFSKKWGVGIKEVEGGVFSTYANKKLKIGDVIKVMPPQGNFKLKTNPAHSHKYIAFAAGSGITPIMAMLESVLNEEPNSQFYLVYGNKNYEEAMFYNKLKGFTEKYPSQFYPTFFCSRKTEPNASFGRIEKSTINYLFKNNLKDLAFNNYYLCGPEEMINNVKNTLIDNGVIPSKIEFELFTSSIEADQPTITLEGVTNVTVTVDNETFNFSISQQKYLLDAILAEKIDAPYSCQGGICSSCIAKVKEGKATMVKNQILTDSEIEEGLILTCQAHATTPTIVIDYDDV